MDIFDLIVNNETGKAMKPTRGKAKSINDLTFTTLELSPLGSSIINKELMTQSDYELITFNISNLDNMVRSL